MHGCIMRAQTHRQSEQQFSHAVEAIRAHGECAFFPHDTKSQQELQEEHKALTAAHYDLAMRDADHIRHIVATYAQPPSIGAVR